MRWITEEERRQAAEARRDMSERHAVEMAFADWVMARSGGEGVVYVPPLSEEMMARLRTLLLRGEATVNRHEPPA
jgi:hypothetical protein